MQQEGDYSSWGHRSGQVKAAEAPDAGEMGLGAEPKPSLSPQARGSSNPMPGRALWMGWGRSCEGIGTGRLGVLLTVEQLKTEMKNDHNCAKPVYTY